ncbi:MAG TPA: tetratricopeptide repeat protein [Fimbriiglobus sp.]|nr:tetratricopeptide repeat protein [Fimbriiglobus sp.]
MDGRWSMWVCAGLIAGAVGCKSTGVPTAAPAAGNQAKPSLLEQAFGGSPRFNPQAPPAPELPIPEARNPDEPPKPEFWCLLAAAEVESAYMEGRPAVDRDRLLDSARQKYQRALKTEPHYKGAMVGLAELYAKTGNKDRAVATFREALQHAPKDHDLSYKMAVMQVNFHDWAGAVQSCQYALSLDPENRTYSRTYGYCQAQLGQFQQAGETLMKVMPEAKVRYFLGRVLIDQKRDAEGRQMIQAAVAQDPDLQQAKEFLAQLDTGAPTKPTDVKQATFDDTNPSLPTER